MTIEPLAGPRSASCALVTSSLYQAEKSSAWGVTPRSRRASFAMTPEGSRGARTVRHREHPDRARTGRVNDVEATLSLWDYRRRVSEMYARVRAGDADEGTWRAWRRER